MRYLLILLGISLTSGSIFGITTGLYRVVQLMSGVCSPSSSDEMKSLLSPRKIVRIGQLSPSDDTTTIFLRPSLEEMDQNRSIEVSEVYIDAKTCAPMLLEKFLTHIINYPPKRGLGSVRVFYRENLNRLGDNLKNALQNTFRHVEQIH